MNDSTIARNYAEALLSLARKAEDVSGWGSTIDGVADAMQRDDRLRLFLESPRIGIKAKTDVLTKALEDCVPRLFLRFLQALVKNRRQMLIPAIANEYRNLVDESEGRVHARVTVARETSDAESSAIAAQLSRVLGKNVVPHLTVNPDIGGGIIVRVGDTVMDGSVRKRLATLRSRLLAAK